MAKIEDVQDAKDTYKVVDGINFYNGKKYLVRQWLIARGYTAVPKNLIYISADCVPEEYRESFCGDFMFPGSFLDLIPRHDPTLVSVVEGLISKPRKSKEEKEYVSGLSIKNVHVGEWYCIELDDQYSTERIVAKSELISNREWYYPYNLDGLVS